MRIFRPNADDMMRIVVRCLFDLDSGRAAQALERVTELRELFGRDASILYAEGQIRRGGNGEGIAAFECYREAAERNPQHPYAAENAVMLAPTEEAVGELLERAQSAGVEDEELFKSIGEMQEALAAGRSISSVHFEFANMAQDIQEFGDAAAAQEVGLSAGDLTPDDELAARRFRATLLRQLDEVGEHKHQARGEVFAPEDRSALRLAVAEIEKALELDEYDAEMWNLKAAWLSLLGEHDDAIACADHALSLRPTGYAKPYHNKANSLIHMGRLQEAEESVREGLAQAEAAGDDGDIAQSNRMLKLIEDRSAGFSEDDLRTAIGQAMRGVQMTADSETAQQLPGVMSVQQLGAACADVESNLKHRASEFVPFLSEMLTSITPDAVFVATVLTGGQRRSPVDAYMLAALHIAAEFDGVQQRDAARYVALYLISQYEPDAVREAFKNVVVAHGEAGPPSWRGLPDTIRRELCRVRPEFADLAPDEPVDEQAVRQAAGALRREFAGGIESSSGPSSGSDDEADEEEEELPRRNATGAESFFALALLVCPVLGAVLGWRQGGWSHAIWGGLIGLLVLWVGWSWLSWRVRKS